MTKQLDFSTEFYSLSDITNVEKIELTHSLTNTKHIIPNATGKQASLKIYYHLICNNLLGKQQANLGLKLFGDYTQEEINQPNSHPNIRLLLDTIEQDLEWHAIIFNKKL